MMLAIRNLFRTLTPADEELARGRAWGLLVAKDNDTEHWAMSVHARVAAGQAPTLFERAALVAVGHPLPIDAGNSSRAPSDADPMTSSVSA